MLQRPHKMLMEMDGVPGCSTPGLCGAPGDADRPR